MTETALLNLGAWSVQAGLLALVAGTLTRIVLIDAPGARYAWWRAVLVVCLALPVIQPWQPAWPVPVGPVFLETPGAAKIETPDSVAAVTRSPRLARNAAPGWPAIIAAVLVSGALLRLAWLAAGLVRLRHTRRAGVPAGTTDGPDVLHDLIEAGADVRHVGSLRQPVTFGLVRPVVLLPGAFGSLPLDVQRAVLAHELWHVRRHDWLWSLAEETLRAIFWFHPAIGYLVSRVQCAREEVVDELSILSTNSRRSYLEALLAFADEPAVYPAAPFARRRQLFNRMMLISREGVMSPKRIVASTAGMAGALVMAGWYGAQAFPLTDTAAAEPREPDAQAQSQPRDPRPEAARPATAREEVVKAATVADPSDVKKWLELAKLLEDRGAVADAEATLEAAFSATSGSRDVLMAQARFLGRNGQFDRSMTLLENAAAQNPMDPTGYQLVATYYWEKAQKDQALTPADKLMYIDRGIAATDSALAQNPDYIEALTYKNILLRMKGNLQTDTAQRQQLVAEADVLRNRAMELSKQRKALGTPPGAPPGAPPPPPPPPPPSQHYQIDGQEALRVGGEIKTPVKLHDVRPVYPPEAHAAGISGVVIIEVAIDTQGNVRSTFVKRSIPALDQAALDAVKQWRFAPTFHEGAAVPVLMTVTVNFTLQ